MPRIQHDLRQHSRIPYAAAIKVYAIVGKDSFDAALNVRCRDLSASGISFISHQTFETGTKMLLRLPGLTPERPLNIIGTVVRSVKITPPLHVIAARFDAVPADEPAVTPGAPVERSAAPAIAKPAAVEHKPTPKVTAPILASSQPAESKTADDELARIRAAVLF